MSPRNTVYSIFQTITDVLTLKNKLTSTLADNFKVNQSVLLNEKDTPINCPFSHESKLFIVLNVYMSDNCTHVLFLHCVKMEEPTP